MDEENQSTFSANNDASANRSVIPAENVSRESRKKTTLQRSYRAPRSLLSHSLLLRSQAEIPIGARNTRTESKRASTIRLTAPPFA